MSSRSSSRGAGLNVLAKRSVAVLFVAAGLALALSQFALPGFSLGSLSALVGAQQRPGRVQTLNNADCDYLRDPEAVRGFQARHRREVSQTTDAISRNLEHRALSLVSPDDLPRKTMVDSVLFDRMGKEGISSAPLCTDGEYIRRVTLDLTGRIPSPQDIIDFYGDPNPYKRDVLVDKLIASPEFIDKWTMFFGDLYKNTTVSTNINRYIGGREAFHNFIRSSIAENKSYDQMASEMISASGDNYANGAVNFIVGGFVPMGPVQDTMDGTAVVTATTFLGLSSMDCLLCHDGAGHLDQINLWGAKVKRADAWGMAAFFARTNRRFERANANVNYGKYTVTENATGEYNLNTNSGNRQTRAPINGRNNVAPNYPFGGGAVANGENRRVVLARYVTADPQFARATVNYIWEELMVEALVSPSNTFDPDRLSPDAKLPDGWSLQPANADLLQGLAQDFKDNGFNLRHLIGMIAKSSAYQLSTQYPGDWKIEYVPYYARKFARRLGAEEIHDAIVKATGQVPVTTFRDASQVNQTIVGYPILGDDNAKLREVQWAMQLPEPAEPRQRGDVAQFLNSFLRGNRDANTRTQDSSILQSLNMMNNNFVMTRIHMANRITNVPNTPEIPSTVRKLLADTTLTNDQIVIQLYLSTLSRFPTDGERAKAQSYYSTQTKQVATENLQWVLLNKVDFLFNY